MRRSIALIGAAGLALSLAPAPAGAQGISTPVATQQNVRHLKTVPGATGGHAVVEGNRLYVGAYGAGMRIFDISNPRSPVQIGQYIPGPHAEDTTVDPGVRADAVPDAAVFGGRHIATLNGTSRAASQSANGVTVRGTQQTEFLDVTDPANPVLLARLMGPAEGEAHNGDIVDARKLWLPSAGRNNDAFRIYDLSPLLGSPAAPPQKLFAGNPVSMWQNSPIRIRANKPVGSPASSGTHHIHDIEAYTDRNVLLPEWEWVDQDGDDEPDPTWALKDIALVAWSTGYTVDLEPGSNTHSIFVIDITDPTNPVVINRWQNTNDGDMIRYMHEVQFLHGDPNTMIATDEDLHSGCDSGRMYVIRVSDDLMSGTKVSEWTVGSAQQDTPTCLGAHVLSSHDRKVYMGAYTAGLQVIDLSNPAQPKTVGRYIAEGMNSWGALYHAGVVYVGDMGARGLDVFEYIEDPVAKGIVKAANPATRTTFGVSERGCMTLQDPHGPTDQVDALMVTIPEEVRDRVAAGEVLRIRGLGGSAAPYELDIWFYSESCSYMAGTGAGDDGGDAIARIPEGAGYASITVYTGAPATWVYAQII
jgi:hypothetical protein